MKIINKNIILSDLSFDDVQDSTYDLVILANGYEKRCTFISCKLKKKNFKEKLILDFEESSDHKQRLINNDYFKKEWITDLHVIMSSNNELPLYDTLNSLKCLKKEKVKIFVDYTSMSRLWYTGILNWVRYSSHLRSIEIDFGYSLGKYKEDIGPMVIDDILALPGCEGVPDTSKNTIGIFGLGFDGDSTLTVMDQLEANKLYAYIPNPGAFANYPERTKYANKDLLDEDVVLIELPLKKVALTYSRLSELISSFVDHNNVVIIPMGPKPHILAALFLAFKYPTITLLRVNGTRHNSTKTPEPIGTNGEIIVTRFTYNN